ncbi:MAG TPA: hypothetical protein VF625_03130, partial [Longimicrobium sp.]
VLNMHVATLIHDLEIELADAETAARIASNIGGWTLFDEKVFLLRGRNFQGHVVCDTVTWDEADVDWADPSALMAVNFSAPTLPDTRL